jgi:hypothetical protein
VLLSAAAAHVGSVGPLSPPEPVSVVAVSVLVCVSVPVLVSVPPEPVSPLEVESPPPSTVPVLLLLLLHAIANAPRTIVVKIEKRTGTSEVGRGEPTNATRPTKPSPGAR